MKVKDIIAEDFCNYCKPSMFIVSCICDWKCCTEANIDISVCQNQPLINQPTKDIPDDEIYQMYISNPISRAVVIGGLEPMLQFDEVLHLIETFRSRGCNDEFVIYTGYYANEITDEVRQLYGKNIIMKFGRYVPNQPSDYSDILGVELASSNQYAVQL